MLRERNERNTDFEPEARATERMRSAGTSSVSRLSTRPVEGEEGN